MRYKASILLAFLAPSIVTAQSVTDGTDDSNPPAEQVLPNVDDLTDGVRAFMCDIEESGPGPVILIQEEGQWRLYESLNIVTEIDEGFRFTSTQTESFLGILSEKSGDWRLNILDESGQYSGDCQSMDEFTEGLATAIAPKLYANANSLGAELTDIKELLEQSRDNEQELNSRVQSLIDQASNMREEILSLEKSIDDLLPNLVARTLAKVGAYSDEYGYELTNTEIDDFSFDLDVEGAQMCFNILSRNSTPLMDSCFRRLQNALLPNPEK